MAASVRYPASCLAGSSAAQRSGVPDTASQNRATAMFGSRSYCSKNSHCSTCARSKRSSGRNGVPSARKQMIAPDSPSARPSSSTSVGTRSAGFSPPSTSGRSERSSTSISTSSSGRPSCAASSRTL